MTFDTSTWPGQERLVETWRELVALDLLENVAELAAFGLTVVPPEKTGAQDLTARVLDRCLELMEERTGVKPDLDGGESHRDKYYPSLHSLLYEDPVFEELIMHPVALALASYMLGRTMIYGGSELFVKGPTTDTDPDLQLGLHNDLVLMPAPLPIHAVTVNATWTLTDYTKDDGSLAFLPGSHNYCRQPVGDEGLDKAVPVETPKGSLVLWHGNTWHGSYPKKTPGLRIGLALLYTRKYLLTPEPVAADLTQEIIDRNPPRFAELVGAGIPFGWRAEGPDMAKLARAVVRRVYD